MLANKDLWAGVIFVAFGLAGAIIARGYPVGTAARMGPGYFPTALGILLIVLGGAIVIRGLRSRGRLVSELWPTWDLRAALWIVLAVVVFAAGIRPLGLVATVALTVAIACVATRRYPLRESAAVVATLVLVASGLFAWALGLPLRLWPA